MPAPATSREADLSMGRTSKPGEGECDVAFLLIVLTGSVTWHLC